MLARHARNNRLYDAIDQWAFCSLQTSPGARAYYDQRRQPATPTTKPSEPSGTGGSAPPRLPEHRTPYDEHTAWGHRQPPAA